MKTAGTEMQRHTHVDAHIGEMDSHRKNIKPTNEPIESCLYIYIYISNFKHVRYKYHTLQTAMRSRNAATLTAHQHDMLVLATQEDYM